jgi:hypothetical protein
MSRPQSGTSGTSPGAVTSCALPPQPVAVCSLSPLGHGRGRAHAAVAGPVGEPVAAAELLDRAGPNGAAPRPAKNPHSRTRAWHGGLPLPLRLRALRGPST